MFMADAVIEDDMFGRDVVKCRPVCSASCSLTFLSIEVCRNANVFHLSINVVCVISCRCFVYLIF